jgi:hypothetical protein
LPIRPVDDFVVPAFEQVALAVTGHGEGMLTANMCEGQLASGWSDGARGDRSTAGGPLPAAALAVASLDAGTA